MQAIAVATLYFCSLSFVDGRAGQKGRMHGTLAITGQLLGKAFLRLGCELDMILFVLSGLSLTYAFP